MKKRLLSILLAALMVFSLLPVTAFAAAAPDEGHDLIVKNGDEKATAGTDYEWDTDDQNKLIIKKMNLTVSGTTAKEYIEVAESARSLIIEDLTINAPVETAITFLRYNVDTVLESKGENSFSAYTGVGINAVGYVKIIGEGDLSLAGESGSTAIVAVKTLTLDCHGTVTADGGVSCDEFVADVDTGKAIIYGDDDDHGAINANALTSNVRLKVTGSATYKANESDIAGEVVFDGANNCAKTGSAVSKSVLFSAPDPVMFWWGFDDSTKTLYLSATKEAVSAKSVEPHEFNSVLRSRYGINESSAYYTIIDAPWSYNRYDITTVEFLNEVAPVITDFWFYEMHSLQEIKGIEHFDTSNVKSMNRMFYDCSALESLNLSGLDTSNVTDMNDMFYYCSALKSLNLSKLDTSNVTDMAGMFGECNALTTLDVSSFVTSKVTDMEGMFGFCYALESLDLSSFDTSKVTNMSSMFGTCNALTALDLSNFDTSCVSDYMDGNTVRGGFDRMFNECRELETLDISNFNTSGVTMMSGIFYSCHKLKSLDLSSFDTSKVTTMEGMFNGCNALTTLDLSSFDTSKVTTMEGMFTSCRALESLDLSSFDTSNVTNMKQMFRDCTALKTLDLSGFDCAKVTDAGNLFQKWPPNSPGYTITYLKTPKNLTVNAPMPTVAASAKWYNADTLAEYTEANLPKDSAESITLVAGTLVGDWGELQTAINETATTSFILTDDLTAPEQDGASITIPNGKDISLDLNGHVINANGGAFSVIKVEEGGKLTLIDSKPETEHKGYVDANGLWHLGEIPQGAEDCTEKTVLGGVITGGTGTEEAAGTNGGGVIVHGAFNMNGGNIVGNSATAGEDDDGYGDGYGGGVFVDHGTFTMTDGAIAGNTAYFGGGVYVYYNGTFTMSGGTITGNTADDGGVYNSGTFTMSGGTISNNNIAYLGGGVYNKGKFTMSGGEITGNTAASYGGGVFNSGTVTLSGTAKITGNDAENGGGVYVYYNCTFTMADGTISGNTATYGGGVDNDGGTFTMTGGNIVGNKVTPSEYGGTGGGVYNAGGSTFTMTDGAVSGNEAHFGGGVYNSGTFTMSGGTISENTAVQKGGGVYNNGMLTLGGTAQITGNTLSDGTTANNLYLLNGKKVTLGTGTGESGNGVAAPADGMSVGVTMATPGTFTGTATETQNGYFSSDNSGYEVAFNEGHLELKEISGGVSTWSALQDAINKAPDNTETTIQLTQDLTVPAEGGERLVIPAGKNIALDLNGFTLDRGLKNENTAVDKGNVFTVNGKLTIQDNSTAKTGKITGGTSAYGAAIISNGETILEGGTITECKATSTEYDSTNSQLGRGAIYVNKNGKFTMSGGEIKNCSASVAGGAIFNIGTVNITGGMIDGCSVSGVTDGDAVKAKGGAVYNYGYSNFTMTGGEISGNTLGDVADMRGAGVYAAADANVTLGGTAKITGNTDGKENASNLFLYDGASFTISTDKAPETGMNVGVTTKTAPVSGTPVKFTTNGASTDTGYFTSDNTNYEVEFKTDHLELKVTHAHEIEMILVALNGDEKQGTIEGVLEVEDDESLGFRTVKLLKDVDLDTANVTVAENVFLDLNHFNLTTTGTVTNNGTIILHQKNADVVDYLLYNAPGNYATSEELKLPTDAAPDYVIPANTFMTAKVGTTPAYQELGFASGDDMLVWNKDVPAGMQLDVVYSLTLGGNILSAKTAGIKDTNVTAVNFALNDDISIGSNTETDGAATLTIKSLYDEEGDPTFDTIATFVANGKTITLNKTGKLVISSDATGFDESVLVSGVPGMSIQKKENKAAKTVTYSIAVPSPALNGKTDKTITITAVEGLEYSINGGATWVSDNGNGDGDSTTGTITFTGLTANKAYTIIARVQATGESSTASVITTKSAEQPQGSTDPVDVIGSEIVSGETVVEVKGADGEDISEDKLAKVAKQINEVLDSEPVKEFNKDLEKTDLDEATEGSNNEIVSALKSKTTDTTAKNNVSETNISKYLNVKLVSANVDTMEEAVVTALVFDVTPMATITVTGSNGEVTLTTEIPNEQIDGTVTFLLPVDKSIEAETAAVYHEGKFLDNYEIKPDGSGNKYIKVTTNSFSEFGYITFDETTAGAQIGDTYYASLSDAVSKVANNETIKLLKDASDTITVSRAVKFTVDVNSNTNNATITAGSGYTVSKSGNTYTVSAYSGGGGGGGSSSYAVELPANVKNGKVEVSPKNASAGQTVTLTVTPDKGFTLETLTVLDKNGKEIEVKNLGENKYSFKMPSGKVSISATFMEDNTMLNFFVDVKATDYYYDAVLWAAENEITKGTDAVHFSPNAPVTRAQVVTFLWRAAGKPVVNYAMSFVDVSGDAYYTEAVRWAVAEGITKGTSDTTFSPDKVCTRGQIVTFLARFAGVEDDASGYSHGFTDVEATDYYNNAVAWAKDNKVTEGTSAKTFSPNTDCTRAQVVTFLYRWMVK